MTSKGTKEGKNSDDYFFKDGPNQLTLNYKIKNYRNSINSSHKTMYNSINGGIDHGDSDGSCQQATISRNPYKISTSFKVIKKESDNYHSLTKLHKI